LIAIAGLLTLAGLARPVVSRAEDSPECFRFVTRSTLLGEFAEEWDDEWKKKKLNRHGTVYEVIEEEGERVLQADSERSASLLLRKVKITRPEGGWLSWRWNVDRSLSENVHETEKKGDDYSARVFVIFDPGLFGRNTRSICYVWAGNQPIGSTYRSPYARKVMTVVVQSGDEWAGEWLVEKRNVVADFTRLFGESPPSITGVAVMVDTDNTKTEARAWFDEIVLAIGSQEGEVTQLE
jgi:hypothetical protein